MTPRTTPRCLLAALALLGAGTAQAQSATQGGPFATLDANHDGAVSRAEFQAGYPWLVRTIALDLRLRDQYQALDADHSGAIESGEYARMTLVQRAGPAAPAFARFDGNGNRKLEFDEYLVAVRQLATATTTKSTATTAPAPNAARK